MPDSHTKKQRRRRRLIDPQTFVQYLTQEIERYDRYQRGFALVLIQVPTAGSYSERLMALGRASALTRRLVRGCDLVASFSDSGLLAALLPETGPAGARVVFDRFTSQIGKPGGGWTLKIATYPEHTEVIDYFLSRAEELVRGDAAATWTTAADHRLWQVPAPVPPSPPGLSPARDTSSPRRLSRQPGARSRRGRRGAA